MKLSVSSGDKNIVRVSDAEFAAGAVRAEGLPAPALAEIAFAGRSNVGKSSLLNAMMQRKSLARTSNTPGCTRQINVFRVRTSDGLEVGFVDLPGYGYARRAKSEKVTWGPMLEGYLRERVTLRAVVLLVDVRRGLEDDDRQLIDFMRAPRGIDEHKPVEVIVVATKLDKLALSARKPALDALKKLGGVKPLGFSSVTGEGREELWRRLRSAVL
jgi:GTP-binding protein